MELINNYKELAVAIITTAINDYKNALKGRAVDGKPAYKVKYEIETFLRSDYFTIINPTNINGEAIIDELQQSTS